MAYHRISLLPCDLQAAEPLYHCCECGAEIYPWRDYTILQGDIYCPACAEEETVDAGA